VAAAKRARTCRRCSSHVDEWHCFANAERMQTKMGRDQHLAIERWLMGGPWPLAMSPGKRPS